MSGRRRPTPVQVVVFPKKQRSRTQTVPELATPLHDAVTEVEVDVRGRRGKRTKSGSFAKAPTVEELPAVADSASDMMALVHELLSMGRLREAKIVFEGLMISDPTDAFTRTMLGTISLALDDSERALSHFEAALQLEPNDVAALVYRGELRLQHKKVRQAIEDFEHALVVSDEADPFADRARRLLKLARKPARKA